MNRTDPSPRWYAPWRVVEPAPVQDDPADMGTAFGLDLSMAPAAESPAETPAADEPGWMQRLARRKRAT